MEEQVQEVKTVTRDVTPAGNVEPPQKAFAKKKAIFRAHQIIWYILGFIEVLLGFRVALLALGANPASGFTMFIYGISAPLAAPFRGIFGTSVSGGYVFEWSTLLAALVYAIIAYGIVYLMQLGKPVTPTEVNRTVDNT
jgi:hypothetical protein